MEKLHELMRLLLLGLLALFSSEGFSQESFVVFKKEGNPVFTVNDSLKSIRKGTQLTTNCSVTLGNEDTLLYVDKEGSCYSIETPGTYAYGNLAAVQPKRESGSFTKRYLAYVWDEFAKRRKTKSKSGVVYRIDGSVLLRPDDSVKIYRPVIEFDWLVDSEESYILLKDMEDGHITKMGIAGTSITLFVDNKLLRKGHTYQWAISDTQFPDLTALEFNTFELISLEEFREMETELEDLKKDLKSLGLTSEEIRQSLCSDYKFCY